MEHNGETVANEQKESKTFENNSLNSEFVPLPGSKRSRPSGQSSMYNDIEEMMFGFGDQWPPDEESVKLVESIVTNYIEDLTIRAAQIATVRPNGKLDKECFMFVVRKDRRKFSRIHNLLTANEELKSVQKMEMKDPETTEDS